MRIASLELRLWGFDFRIGFEPGVNVIIGMNGCGKTTALNMIAGLTGNDAATSRIVGTRVGKICLEVVCESGLHKFVSEGVLEWDDIAEFKAKLAYRTSFTLPEDYDDTSLITEVRPQAEIRHLLAGHLTRSNDGEPLVNTRGRCIQFKSGGDGFLQTCRVLSRMAPRNVPMLVEFPERHLHLVARSRLGRVLDQGGQYIVTTHCPEMFHALDSIGNTIDMSTSNH